MNNEQLIKEYRQTRNEQYATELFNKNEKILWEIAHKYNCDIDLCYMGFSKALNNFDETRGKFTTILYLTCENECKMYLRKKRVSTISIETKTDDNLTIADTLADDYDLVESAMSSDNFSAIIGLLSARQQEIMLMRFKEDLSVRQIAQILGLSNQSVANTINKAIRILRGNYAKITRY